MATSVHMRRNDTAPPLEETLVELDGDEVDIQSATVRFHMMDSAGAVIVDAAGNNDQVGDGSDGTKGFVSYDWQAADTAKAGNYRAEWEVTFSDGSVRTFPTVSWRTIIIHDDIT